MSFEDLSSKLPSGESWDCHSVSRQVLLAHLSTLSTNAVIQSSCSSFKCNGSHAIESIFASWVFWRNGMTTCHSGNDGIGNAQWLMSLTAALHHEIIQGAALCWWCREGIGVTLKPPALCCKLQAAFLRYTLAFPRDVQHLAMVKSLFGWQGEGEVLLQGTRAG